jgi:hypothetical protein
MPGTYRHDRNLFPAAYPPSPRGARCALFVCEVAKTIAFAQSTNSTDMMASRGDQIGMLLKFFGRGTIDVGFLGSMYGMGVRILSRFDASGR